MDYRNITTKIIKTKGVGLAHMLMVAMLLLPISSQGAATVDQDTVAQAASGLQMRGIGPALMGGRIADIAVHPANSSTWYVAVGSGGVWKTGNAGTIFTARACRR